MPRRRGPYRAKARDPALSRHSGSASPRARCCADGHDLLGGAVAPHALPVEAEWTPPVQALHRSTHRSAFRERLIHQPSMQNGLADRSGMEGRMRMIAELN